MAVEVEVNWMIVCFSTLQHQIWIDIEKIITQIEWNKWYIEQLRRVEKDKRVPVKL